MCGGTTRQCAAPLRPVGSIPACAGEPVPAYTGCTAIGVYPRVCGGTKPDSATARRSAGLSPRVRGNRRGRLPVAESTRSIPACAGEPRRRQRCQNRRRVYPRVCGGTSIGQPAAARPQGLSPRVRGNPHSADGRPRPRGSIPACAGEPGPIVKVGPPSGVYPRVCGGTLVPNRPRRRKTGLSPRVRGNLAAARDAPENARSIPACAGEPARRIYRSASAGVYPRVCGGTPVGDSVLIAGGWSIPACAGEPGNHGAIDAFGKVYPRVCGGTPLTAATPASPTGLSPRVRGNRNAHATRTRPFRSIPACAGEPGPTKWRAYQQRVYPRVCGGT